MKKTISVLLALVLILAMSTTAFAATIESSPGSQDIDVNAKYVDGVSAPTKYSVDVSWGAMEFTYTVSGTRPGTLRPTPTPPAPSLHGRPAATPSP